MADEIGYEHPIGPLPYASHSEIDTNTGLYIDKLTEEPIPLERLRIIDGYCFDFENLALLGPTNPWTKTPFPEWVSQEVKNFKSESDLNIEIYAGGEPRFKLTASRKMPIGDLILIIHYNMRNGSRLGQYDIRDECGSIYKQELVTQNLSFICSDRTLTLKLIRLIRGDYPATKDRIYTFLADYVNKQQLSWFDNFQVIYIPEKYSKPPPRELIRETL
jgi:hypothetical protein